MIEILDILDKGCFLLLAFCHGNPLTNYHTSQKMIERANKNKQKSHKITYNLQWEGKGGGTEGMWDRIGCASGVNDTMVEKDPVCAKLQRYLETTGVVRDICSP